MRLILGYFTRTPGGREPAPRGLASLPFWVRVAAMARLGEEG
ncbi:hypothetical protein N788_06405 [Arenimonas donghaensis DSM 18148 = HO3-R19]|uniref:Uncharacterized protein n=1 Tax=Arenimonas donghaensis DSM 18148 = HO3-R19 TaxID=1121014 RepID=A0A087MG98_9GAMM|nr:hypothetical protein N788_06405 [Arenimonas donghaensis DSM 18148 = HO3-R19]